MQLTPLSSISTSISYYKDRFLFAPERDGDGTRLLVGGQFSPRALLSGRVEAGYLGTRSSNPEPTTADPHTM